MSGAWPPNPLLVNDPTASNPISTTMESTQSRSVSQIVGSTTPHAQETAKDSKKRARTELERVDAADDDSSLEEAVKEAGLSLLFEASLLQQPNANQKQGLGGVDGSGELEQVGGQPNSHQQAASAGGAAASAPAHSVTEPPNSIANNALTIAPVFPHLEVPNASINTTAGANTSTSLVHHDETFLPKSVVDGGGDVVDASGLSRFDVLCGRGGLCNKHNVIFRMVVEHNKQHYKTVPKRHRVLVSQSIVQTILNRGGRFLVAKKNGSTNQAVEWHPIHFNRAVSKTSQALREPPLNPKEAGSAPETAKGHTTEGGGLVDDATLGYAGNPIDCEDVDVLYDAETNQRVDDKASVGANSNHTHTELVEI